MKNKVFLIIAFLVLFFNIKCVSATTTCEYDKIGLTVTFDEAGTATINQDFYPNEETPWWINWLVNQSSGNIDSTEELKWQPKELFGFCPEKIVTCKYEEWSVNTGIKNLISGESGRFLHLSKVYLFYSEGEMNENKELSKVENNGEWDVSSEYITSIIEGYKACSGYGVVVLEQVTGFLCGTLNGGLTGGLKTFWELEEFAVKRKECFTSEYTGELPTYNLACSYLNVYFDRFRDSVNKYKACSEDDAVCISKSLTDVNEKEELVKSYCKSILANQDYDGGTEQDCLDACLSVGKNLIALKKDAGILSTDTGNCGFSARLLVWISNIMRWIKYIMPVGVIILGILDFIKAIGSDKDDDMKKAQGRFIKRLIAAALVFLIPLIIEFVLDKMGFGYDACGLF